MFDLEAIERRYLVNSPACEDIPDLITEVRRLQALQKPAEPKKGTPKEIPKNP